MDHVSKRIKHYRKLADLTQQELSDAIGYASQSRIGNYETGCREPSLEDLEAIAKVLGISLCALVTDAEEDEQEAKLLSMFRRLTTIDKSRVYGIIKILGEPA